MHYVVDLHLHSKYSRAVSKDMLLEPMAVWGKKKGTNILTTGDWTHPLWLREIQTQLDEIAEGLFKLKSQKTQTDPYFLLSTEISSIYSQGGKVRRIHNLVFVPSFATAEKIGKALIDRGCNLMADGRPIIGLSAKDLLELVLSIDKHAVVIPCHIWTPWFSVFGSNSGFDSLEECFGNYTKFIYGIETGLSSDPEMNWQIKELQNKTILSFSDAHSPAKMGREATVLDLVAPSYKNVMRAMIHPTVLAKTASGPDDEKLKNKIAFTIEFHPEEGKYHYNGHRNCKVVQSPDETNTKGRLCPVCKRPMTIGVMQRVDELANKKTKATITIDEKGVKWFADPSKNHPPFVKLVPLNEIIAESFGVQVQSQKVKQHFDMLAETFGSEMQVLLHVPIEELSRIGGERVAQGVRKVRSGDMVVEPGFDGEYGKVKIWQEGESETKPKEKKTMKETQTSLF